MKIKEVQAGIKIIKNYNSYQASLMAELETGEDSEKVGADLMEKALSIVSKKIKLNEDLSLEKESLTIKEKHSEIEVGAAWPAKKFNDGLSIKMSKTGNWEEVLIQDLEKTKEGYKQETSEGVFIFKKIPEDKRTSNKMPTYRIYKIEDKDGI